LNPSALQPPTDPTEAYRAALAREPGNAVALNNLAALLQLAGRAGEAAPLVRRAAALVPDVPEVLLNVGDCLRLLRRSTPAASVYRRALALRSGFPEALNNLGLVLRDLDRRDEAAECFARAVEARPDYAEALNNLGNAVHGRRRIGEAVNLYRKALAIRPELAAAWANSGNACLDLAGAVAASRRFRRSLAIAADPLVHTNLIFSMLSDPAAGPAAELAEARRWAARHIRGEPLAPRSPAGEDPDRPLILGYLSADLRRHPVAGSLIEVIDRHDRDRFRLHFYAEVRSPDRVTERFRARADRFLSTVGLSDAELAAAIRRDGVDILVVVAAHTAAHRLAAAALRPAPVAASLYAPCTTGAAAIDIWLSDPYLTPPEQDRHFVEQVHRLPTFCTYPEPVAPAPPQPRDGPPVFGSFNNPGKLNDAVFAAWRRILAQLAAARLRIGYQRYFDDAAIRRRVFDAMAGVSDRVEFLPEAADAAAHLARLGEVDIVLDSFPYGGANSTFEPLWMGTPVVTLAGDRFVGRIGAALLDQIGLADLVAGDPEAYAAAAIRLAGDAPRRALLRAGLRERLRRCRYMDHAGQTRALEDAYRLMWHRWCGEPE
jgi:predicted O-linked N-acetylglucosamine transferase (SPINDLY family)